MKNVTTLPIIDIEKSEVLNVPALGIFTSLTEKGLNKLTKAEIEHILCTSSLAAFN